MIITAKIKPEKSTVSAAKQRLQEKQREENEKNDQKNRDESTGLGYERDNKDESDQDAAIPSVKPSNRSKFASKDADTIINEMKEKHLKGGPKRSLSRDDCLNNDKIVIKDVDKLLKDDEINKSEKSEFSSLANSKKLEKFKSNLKRTFQAEDTSLVSEKPNKLSKIDTSLPMPINPLERQDSTRAANEKSDEGESKKSSVSSSSPTPSSPDSSHGSPTRKSSSASVLPLKHRHYHPKKAMAAASATATETTKGNGVSNNNNGSSNNKEVSAQEKEKKNISESSTPPPSNGTPSKTNPKKKQKSKCMVNICKDSVRFSVHL